MQFPSLSILSLLLSISSVYTHQRLPVCVIGAGPSGIHMGRLLKSHNITHRVFEAEAYVGGKSNTWRDKDNIGVEMGTFFFAKDSKYSIKAVLDAGFSLQLLNGSAVEIYNQNFKSIPMPAFTNEQKAAFIKAANRYSDLRESYNLTVGYVNVPAEAQVSLAQWLKNKNLQILSTLFIPFVTIQGYGSLEDIPAIYIIKAMNIRGFTSFQDFPNSLHTVPAGLDKLWAKLSQNLNLSLNHSVKYIDRTNSKCGKQSIRLHFENKSLAPVTCSHVVMAFPPYLSKIQSMVTDLEPQEEELISKIKNQYYGTTVVENKGKDWKSDAILNLISESEKLPVEPIGDGETVGFLKQGKYYSGYCWKRGDYQGLPPQSLIQSFRKQQTDLLKKMDRVKNSDTRIVHEKYFPYFPHVTVADIQQGFFKKFDALQGYKNTFYATPALSFELVNTSLEMAEHIFNTKILPKIIV